MTVSRIDGWEPKHDIILVETVLRNIRTGGIQLDAFDEVGHKVGRTAAACGYRWNKILRKKHQLEFDAAMAERLAKIRASKGRRKR